MDIYGLLYNNIILHLSVIFALFMSDVISQCPSEANRMAQECADHVLSQIHYTIFSEDDNDHSRLHTEKQATKSAHSVEEACKNGKLLDFVDCLQEIHEECKYDNSQTARIFRDSMDFDNIVESVNYLCDNSEQYVKHSACIYKQRPHIDECVKPEMMRFENLTKESQDMNLQLHFQCRFMVTAFYCTSSLVEAECGEEAGHIVQRLISLNKPPVCDASIFNFNLHKSAANNMCVFYNLLCFMFYLSISSTCLMNHFSIK